MDIGAANCHFASVVAKRTRIPCCLALHRVSYAPQEMSVSIFPRICIRKKKHYFHNDSWALQSRFLALSHSDAYKIFSDKLEVEGFGL